MSGPSLRGGAQNFTQSLTQGQNPFAGEYHHQPEGSVQGFSSKSTRQKRREWLIAPMHFNFTWSDAVHVSCGFKWLQF